MSEGLYQLLALAARALFLALAALTALRAFLSLLRQHRARRKLLKQLPDAGMVGEMRDIESDRSIHRTDVNILCHRQPAAPVRPRIAVDELVAVEIDNRRSRVEFPAAKGGIAKLGETLQYDRRDHRR